MAFESAALEVVFSEQQIDELLDVATGAARQAGNYIRQFDRRLLHVDTKSAGASLSSQVVTQVDLDSQALILETLKPMTERYGFAVLSEENASEEYAEQHLRHQCDYFWCIDPLDGTLPFIEGTSGYAVSIALVARSGKSILGVVLNPINNDLYQAVHYQQAPQLLKNGQPWRLPANKDVFTLFVDRSFLSDPRYIDLKDKLTQLARDKGYAEVKVQSQFGAVMNAIGVMEQRPACYLKLPKASKGGGSLWDFSATAAIATAAEDMSVSDIYGQALDLNRIDSNFMNHRGVVFNASDIQNILPLCCSLAGEG
ncbi:3'(2'),5'-bisphosphate nucleotidase CysQ family protein [Photobacterium minamisatsumaniensis]|uniref:3'(2'),5'-bisphosphate nucleotidase CysQ family protein n=1 Tax=Photobacterium minamisatsumaniensis TaxID=2910233 RepID=UPI003D0D8EEA